MSSYTKTNLRQVEDQSPNFGMPAEIAGPLRAHAAGR